MPSRGRSALTNGTRLHDGGVDHRSPAARRFKDLTQSFAAPLGGFDSLDETRRALVRSAASLTMHAERLQAALARGDNVDADELVRVSSEARRALESVRQREPQPKSQSLADYISACAKGTAA
jgi:hypothetical protein